MDEQSGKNLKGPCSIISAQVSLLTELISDIQFVLRHEVQHTHADDGDDECDCQTAKIQQEFILKISG